MNLRIGTKLSKNTILKKKHENAFFRLNPTTLLLQSLLLRLPILPLLPNLPQTFIFTSIAFE